MTTAHHDPHTFGAPLTAAEMNAPLGQLDAAIDAISPVLDIRSFGALAAATDNAVAIQATLDEQKANGGIVYIPEGTFLTSPLTYVAAGQQALHIAGAGRDRSILKPKAGTGTVLTISGPTRSSTFRDFAIDGTGGTAHGLYYSSTGSPNWIYQAAFANLSFTNCALTGLYIKSSFSNRYVNIYAGTNGNDQIKVWGHGYADYYERIDINSTVAGYAGIRSLDGGTFIGCNGIYDTANADGPMFRLGGDGSAESDSQTVYPVVRIIGANVEAFTGTGIEVLTAPLQPMSMAGVQFTTAPSVTARAIDMLASAVDVPLALAGCRFSLGSGASWANGYPIHGEMPLVSTGVDTVGQTGVWSDAAGVAYPVTQHVFGAGNANASAYGWRRNQLGGYTDIEYLASVNLGNGHLGNDWVTRTAAAAMPTSGTYRRGDYVDNCDNSALAEQGAGGSKYTLTGWRRLTDGSAHVLNTDWVERRELTGN